VADGVEFFIWGVYPVDDIGAGDGDAVGGFGSSFPSAEVAGAGVIGVVASDAEIGVVFHGRLLPFGVLIEPGGEFGEDAVAWDGVGRVDEGRRFGGDIEGDDASGVKGVDNFAVGLEDHGVEEVGFWSWGESEDSVEPKGSAGRVAYDVVLGLAWLVEHGWPRALRPVRYPLKDEFRMCHLSRGY